MMRDAAYGLNRPSCHCLASTEEEFFFFFFLSFFFLHQFPLVFGSGHLNLNTNRSVARQSARLESGPVIVGLDLIVADGVSLYYCTWVSQPCPSSPFRFRRCFLVCSSSSSSSSLLLLFANFLLRFFCSFYSCYLLLLLLLLLLLPAYRASTYLVSAFPAHSTSLSPNLSHPQRCDVYRVVSG